MSEGSASFRVGKGAAAALPLLTLSPLAAGSELIDATAGIPSQSAGLVLVVTPSEAGRLLAAPHPELLALILWLADQHAEASLLAHPAVAGVLHPASPPAAVQTVIQSARRLLASQLPSDAARMLEQVLEIGRALASEKDLDTLLSLILTHARSLTGADGASIYTRDTRGSAGAPPRGQSDARARDEHPGAGQAGEPAGEERSGSRAADRDGELYFRLWQNASNAATASAQKTLVGEYSVAGYVARSGQVVQLDDAYAIPESAPYRFNPASDHAIGYRTRSLLTLPLTNKDGDVVGVLQLINRKDRPEAMLRTPEDVLAHVLPFDTRSRQMALALAGQAGVALENSMLHADIERLFEGFIRASVQAIEARDPTTAGHSFRVAGFTERLAMAIDRSDAPDLRALRFSRDALRELRYAALLHDFGKVGVREDVLVKAKKLHPYQLEQLKQRFRYARLGYSWQAYRQLVDLMESGELGTAALRERRRELEQAVAREHQRLEQYLHTILRANEPTVLHAGTPDELREIQGYTFPDGEGPVPLLHDFEFADLALPKGSLTADERVEIESHVSHTYAFLSLIPWTRDLARLPEYAYAHHEKLDGSGYPRGLGAAGIPLQARIMTISDIYDALTAPDRPYKLAVTPERALDILAGEARAGKLDSALLQVFIESRAYQSG